METTTIREWIGHTAVDPAGDKVGKIGDVYVDDETGRPEWLAIKTGLFGTHVSFVPLEGATAVGDELRLAYPKDLIKDAPHAEADGHLEPEEEQRLYRHYGTASANSGPQRDTTADRSDNRMNQASADDAMTRSEEELQVGKERKETERVRLRKYVVTEHEDVRVPVQKEQVRVEREPVTDANRNAAMAGPEISEAEHEVVLHEEQPVVEKRTVPKERVRLEKDSVTGEAEVSEDLRKERIETESGNKRNR